jgi:hypothetical protein
MDRQLLKAYIRTIVEEEVTKILPTLLAEAVSEIKQISETKSPAPQSKKPSIDRGRLAELMGISYDGETLRASTNNMVVPLPENAPRDVDPAIINAVTKDYSQLMKAMKIV